MIHPAVATILLLVCSNILMTLAWYGHLKFMHGSLLAKVILVSWGIALFEYCLAVPANRIGYTVLSGFQLKILQEIITIGVFIAFAWLVLRERLMWNHLVSFALIALAAWFAFGFGKPKAAPESPRQDTANASPATPPAHPGDA